jgi:hypothetical protein
VSLSREPASAGGVVIAVGSVAVPALRTPHQVSAKIEADAVLAHVASVMATSRKHNFPGARALRGAERSRDQTAWRYNRLSAIATAPREAAGMASMTCNGRLRQP